MSRLARALLSPSLDDPSVSIASPAARWRALFGIEPPRAASLVEQAVAWQEQVLAAGDVAPAIARDLALAARHASEARRRPSAEVRRTSSAAPCSTSTMHDAADAAPRGKLAKASTPGHASPKSASRARSRAATAPLPPASSQLLQGTRLMKSHGGRTHVVDVTGSGFAYEGTEFRSLSAVAKHITGTHWNGLLFFGLRRRKSYPAKATRLG